jgi:hypothetical protein
MWKKFTLTANKGVYLPGDTSAGIFSEQLMILGDEKASQHPNTWFGQFPRNFCNIVCSVDELKASVFPDIHHNYRRHEWLCERAILALKNNWIHTLNLQIQNLLLTNCRTYKSVDVVMDPSQAVLYPVEILNSLEPTGIYPHNLELKIGVPIMLLRNLDPLPTCATALDSVWRISILT